jgi:enoyl-CoA hydratase
MSAILTERRDAVALLTINRPSTLNALDVPTLLEFASAFEALEKDPGVHAIVVTGAGDRAFVAGGDIADLDSRQGLAHYLEFAEVIHRVFARIENSDKPTLAAVNGWALGGGTELVLALDLRIAADSARFGLPEINLGLFPGAGGTQRILRQLAPCHAKEIMFTGDHLTAQQALEIGLVNRVVPADRVMPEALELAEKICRNGPLAVRTAKEIALRALGQEPGFVLEKALAARVFASEDAREGPRAFAEKRAPKFTGR